MIRNAAALIVAAIVIVSSPIPAADSFPRRMANPQNTSDVGDQLGLTPESARNLRVVTTIPTNVKLLPNDEPNNNNKPNHTPVVSDGLLFFGDWNGFFYVIDLDDPSYRRLIVIDTGTGGNPGGTLGTYTGVQATPSVGTVTLPEGAGTQKRLYFGANSAADTLWCLDVDRIVADRGNGILASTVEIGAANIGDSPYNCQGASWPMSLTAPESTNRTLNGSALFSARQPIDVDRDGVVGDGEIADVLYTPSTGLDCARGEMFAIDAYTQQKYWSWDPVQNGDSMGGVIWTVPAMDKERKHLYLTTGDCVQKPQVGEMAESLVALDAGTGVVTGTEMPIWWHQRRLVDVADLDIGNAPTVVDVVQRDGEGNPVLDENGEPVYECRNVVTTDKDGCIYAFPQASDKPDVGDLGFDPLRPGQQRMLWRTCFVPGSLNGGFNASGASFHDRYVFAAASFLFGGARVPGDDANAFALDACKGGVLWASSSIGFGRSEGTIASGMYFQTSHSSDQMHVVAAGAGENGLAKQLATVILPAPGTQGGGGVAIAGGVAYVPVQSDEVNGIAVVKVVEDGAPPEGWSPPIHNGGDSFKGPYPEPVAPGIPGTLLPPVNPDDPYPLF